MARTANRGTMSASSPTSYNVMRWRLGKYIRLSKEDLLRGRDESNSVVNQRRLLEQYHQAHLDEFYEGAEADVYVDDGKQVRTPTARTSSGSCPIYPAAGLTA